MSPADTAVPELSPPVHHETALSLASRRVPRVSPTATVAAAREALIGAGHDCVSHVVVLDDRRFVGLVSMEALLSSAGELPVTAIMNPAPPCVLPTLDQEIAALRAIQLGESVLVVVDDNKLFLGLVPAHRLLAVMLQEHEEDLSRIGGFLHSSQQARRSSEETVVRRFWHRIPWLLVGIIGALLAADIVSWFETQLAAVVMIAFFVPGVVYLADAVGTQTETVVVRGLSVGVPMGRMALREVFTGFFIGVAVAVISWALVWLRWGDPQLALGVGIALFFACTIASTVALILPWLFARAGIDPAFGAGPLATVIQDLLSIVIYFYVVTAVIAHGAA